MDDDTSPHEPERVEPDRLDELLSAELDGELDAAARDLGLSVEAVTALMDATPGVEARRVALAAARDLLGVQPEIDELLAQRLRAKAIRAGAEQHAARELDRRHRRRQMLLGAGGIAAAAVAVVALAGGLGHNRRSNTASEKSSANAPSAPTSGSTGKTAPTRPPALGAFSDTRALAAAALVHVAATGGASSNDATQSPSENRPLSATTGSAPQPATASAPTRDANFDQDASGSTKSADAAALGAANACPTPSGVATDDTLVLRATATLSGQPVVVFVFSGRGEHAIAIEDARCALVDIQMQR